MKKVPQRGSNASLLEHMWKAGAAVVALLALALPALALASGDAEIVHADWLDDAQEWAVLLGVKIGGALLIFIGGMIVAKLVSAGVFTWLKKADWDDRLAEKLGIHLLLEGREQEDEYGVERFFSKLVYFLLMLVVIVGVLDYLGLESAAAPLENLVSKVTKALPDIGKAILILTIAYFAGVILQKLIGRALGGMDARISEMSAAPGEDETAPVPFSETTGKVVFWLVMIIGIAGAIEALHIDALAAPMQSAINNIVDLFPKLAIAALILIGGFFLSRIARQIVQSFTHGVGVDKLPEKVKFDKVFEKHPLSEVIGLTVMYIILFHATVAALDRLGLTTLSEPLTDMTSKFWNLLPLLIASGLLIVIGVVFGRVVRGLVVGLLKGVGFDDFMKKLGFEKVAKRSEHIDEPSELVGLIVQVAIFLLVAAQVLDNLALDTWAVYVNDFLGFMLKQAIVATIVLIIGFAVANYVRDAILSGVDEDDDDGRRWLATLARYTILVFATTMAIQQLGVAEDFVLLSFALLFGALCLALALAFGLGSRDVAQDIVSKQYDRAKEQFGAEDTKKKTGLGSLGKKK